MVRRLTQCFVLFILSTSATALEMDYYSYGDSIGAINTFKRLALIFNDNEYIVIFAVFILLGIIFGGTISFGKKLMGNDNDGAGNDDQDSTPDNDLTNDILGGDNGNLNLGLDLELAQNTPDIQTNNRVGVTLQTKINDRILVNGKVGVPFGSASQTVISGDVQIDLLLNEDGTLRAKVFNRENSIRNFGEEIGYTQGVGLSYNVEFDSFKELLQIIFTGKNKKKKKAKNETKKEEESNDGFFPDYMSTKTKKDKTNKP